ncbi:MAG TPA: TetR/AcrR family transcriptional regulator [Acidimicrobiia bacterium]|nr:TetR/AcrR family transcriptional regulator [Acidimicrobiia bacterium]
MAPPKRISREDVVAKVAAVFAGGAAPSMDEMALAAGVSRAALYGLFGSRAALLDAIGADVPPSVEERILVTAGEIVAERGFGGLTLDEVAQRSGVSRATVYRLYPGKAALYREVTRAYLPTDEAMQMMDSMADRPPTEVMATLARSLAQAGEVRIGVLRSVLFEVSGGSGGSNEEFLDEAYLNVQVIIRYLERQMDAGRFRQVDPVLAMQAFLAPVMFHAVSRPALEQYGLLTMSLEDAVQTLTDGWLRSMAPPRRRSVAEKPAAKASKASRARKKARPSPG